MRTLHFRQYYNINLSMPTELIVKLYIQIHKLVSEKEVNGILRGVEVIQGKKH